MAREAIYVGATIAGAPDAAQYFGPVKVPGSMSKKSTIDGHIQKVEEERLAHLAVAPVAFADTVRPNNGKYENHVHRPILGVLTSAMVMAQDGEVLFQQQTKPPHERGKVALPLVNFFKETYPDQFSDSLRCGDSDPMIIVFGFNIKQILRIAALEVLGRNAAGQSFEKQRLPVRLWHNPIGVYDPFDIILPSGDQRDMDLYSVTRYLGILAAPEELSASAELQAATVKHIVEKAQLIPITENS